MPIIKSAKKRVRTAQKAAVRNAKTKRSLRSALKSFHRSLTGGAKKATIEAHGTAQSALDTAVKKGLVHKNKAARQKKQLAAKAKAAAGVVKETPAKAAAAAKKAAAPAVKKPAAAKKTVAKKPATSSAAKKTTVKKTTAKKTAAKK